MAAEPNMLRARAGQMVFDDPSQEEGIDEVLEVTDHDDSQSSDEPINLGGALTDLVDADEMLEALDRIGRESSPTLSITSID